MKDAAVLVAARLAFLTVCAISTGVVAAGERETTNVADGEMRLTAEVVLSPPKMATGELVTAQNVRERLPTADNVARAQAALAHLGFSVGPPIGVGFSITADKSTFERVFHVPIAADQNGQARLAGAGGTEGLDLPVEVLPADLRAVVSAVGFPRPLDFGPSGSFR